MPVIRLLTLLAWVLLAGAPSLRAAPTRERPRSPYRAAERGRSVVYPAWSQEAPASAV